MDEAPPRKKRTFPIHYRFVSDSRFGPQRLELLTDEERDAKLAADVRAAAEKLAAANAAADAAAFSSATSPDQPLPTPPLPPERPPFAPSAPLAPSDPSTPPDFSRHPRRCTICSHPDRDAIEGDFIRWRNPQQIAKAYNLSDRVSVYRHAHYAGLFQRRKRQVARVLETLLESVETCPLEAADMIIRATRLYVRLNEHGEWTEAPRTQYLLTGPASLDEPPNPPSDPAPPKSAKSRRTAARPDHASPKRARSKRGPKILTATDLNSENS